MSIKIIEQRLLAYRAQGLLEQENALKEITQELALAALSRTGFFKVAAFQGGTCLRILYGLNRFSEDLDFSLFSPSPSFQWEPYLVAMKQELEVYGYQITLQDRSSQPNNVKVGFPKDDSMGKILSLRHREALSNRSLKIKFEMDTNPPLGATIEQKYVDFPVTMPVVCHDLPSLFAGKSHALLCREWEKGRDWYDFGWYVGRKVVPNFALLTSAIHQAGLWKEKSILVDKAWYLAKLREKIKHTNWEKQKQDLVRFVKAQDADLVAHWSVDFFLDRVQRLEDYL